MGGLLSCFKCEEDNSDLDEIISSPPCQPYSNTHIVRTERSGVNERPYEYHSVNIRRLDNSDPNEIISSPPFQPYSNTHIVRTERSGVNERPYEYHSGNIKTLQRQGNLKDLEEDGFCSGTQPIFSRQINTDLPADCKKLSPSAIHYTQDSIATTFYERGHHGGVKLGQTLDDLLRDRIQIKDIPRITVCWYKQKWFSLDNRRLWVLKNYEKIKGNIEIIVRVTTFMDEGKFTTLNNGMSIYVRGDPGGTYWKTFKFNMYQ